MKLCPFLAIAIVLFSTAAQAKIPFCDRVGYYGEALIFSNHMGDKNAPPEGYNENNTGLSLGGVCRRQYDGGFAWNNSLGIIAFQNSYNKKSKGVAVASNLSKEIYDTPWEVFGGVNIAFVDNYEQLSSDSRIGDDIGVLPALTAGAAYNYNKQVSFRLTANLIPGVGDADGVFLPTFGVQYLY